MKYLAGLTAAIALTASVLVAAPAQAADPAIGFTFSNLDTSTPGHVTGTVTSDQPFVWVRLSCCVAATKLTLSGGTANFDLETWGFGDSSDGKAQVQGKACPIDPPNEQTCSGLVESERFVPHEVTPQITWFTDDTVGPGQTASLTVSDTGGGRLEAVFVNNGEDNYGTTLDHNGTTALNLGDGDGYVRITRCRTGDQYQCSSMNFSTLLEKDLEVRRTMTAESTGNVVAGTATSSVMDVVTDRTGTYALSWHLAQYNTDNGTIIPGTNGPTQTATGTLVNKVADDVPVDLTGLADADYVPVGTITVVDPDFGTYSNVPFVAGGGFLIDRTPPDVSAVTPSPATIYPLINNTKRPGSTTVTFTGNFEYPETVEIRNASGTAIAHPTLDFTSQAKATIVWDGTNDGGTPQPAGTYKIVVLDQWGNPATKTASVVVSGKRLVTKTYTRTVTARGSLVDQYVGRCSQLRKPSLRGWVGSLGFYANTKCGTTSWNASAVSSVHGIYLPVADRYLDVRVSAYGAAAKSAPRSTAGIRYLTTSGGWTSDRVLSRTLGWHAGATRSASGVVFSDRSFGWGVATAAKRKYDVAKFTVVVRYQTLG